MDVPSCTLAMGTFKIFRHKVLPTNGPGHHKGMSKGGKAALAIFLIALATVLLILDMTRRVRRVRYRAEVQEQIADEKAASTSSKPKPAPED